MSHSFGRFGSNKIVFFFSSKMLEIDTKFNSDEKLWEGPKIKPLFNPKVSMGRVILSMLSMHGPKIAQVQFIHFVFFNIF